MKQIVGEPSTLGNVPPVSLLSRSLPRSETGTSESYQEQNRKTAHRQQRSIQERPMLLELFDSHPQSVYLVDSPEDRVSVLEVELFVFGDGVEDDTRTGLVDIGIDEQFLDLVVHVIGIGELPDRDDVVIAGRLVHRDHVFVLLKPISDIGQSTPFDFELENRRHVVAQLAVVDDWGVSLDDTVLLEIRDVVRHRRHGDVQIFPERPQRRAAIVQQGIQNLLIKILVRHCRSVCKPGL